MIEWTKENIAARSTGEIESLRDNAAKRGRQDIVQLCDEELMRRKPVGVRKVSKGFNEDRAGPIHLDIWRGCKAEPTGRVERRRVAAAPGLMSGGDHRATCSYLSW